MKNKAQKHDEPIATLFEMVNTGVSIIMGAAAASAFILACVGFWWHFLSAGVLAFLSWAFYDASKPEKNNL